MKEIGARIKKIRKILKKSQEDLANDLGITKQAVSNIENSKSLPSIQLLSKLLLDYNINLNYIIAGIGSCVLKDSDSFSELKASLMKEVEEFLDMKGIK